MKIAKLVAVVLTLMALFMAHQAVAYEDRVIELDGVVNTRDLGGLRTRDGRTVRTGQIIRSGEIDGMGAEGMSRLDGLGVAAIVDLRTRSEAANPARWPAGTGPARHSFRLMERESRMIDDMRASIKTGTATGAGTDKLFFDAFGYIATDYAPEIRRLFDVLLHRPEGEAVLYHCSGGKDRTGVVTALVLSALGVTREDIKSDFMLSNVQKDADRKAVQLADKINAKHGTDMSPDAVWPSLGVREAYLDQFYKSMEEGYGSVDRYLRDGLGLTDADLEALRARYLD